MVKKQDKNNSKRQENQEEAGYLAKVSKTGHSTQYDYCNEWLNPFGGLLGQKNVIYKTLAPEERHVKHRNNMPLRWSLFAA